MFETLVYLYLAGLSEALRSIFIFLSIFGVCGIVLLGFLIDTSTHDAAERIKATTFPLVKKYIYTSIIAGILTIFTPNSSFFYIVAGLSASEEIAQTEIAEKAYKVLDQKLTEMLEE